MKEECNQSTTEGWESKYKKQFSTICNYELNIPGKCHYCQIGTHCAQCMFSKIEAFIRQLLTDQKHTLREKVEGQRKEANYARDGAGAVADVIYNQAITDVLGLLNGE